MNIAFLINDLRESEINKEIYDLVNGDIDNNYSIFVKGICETEKMPKCLVTNMTGISCFSGTMITVDLESTITALHGNGNYDIVYYPDRLEWTERPIYFTVIHRTINNVTNCAKNEQFFISLSNFVTEDEDIYMAKDLKELVKCLTQ